MFLDGTSEACPVLYGSKDDTYAWIGRRQRTVQGFETKYTKADITLLADVDRIVDECIRHEGQSLLSADV